MSNTRDAEDTQSRSTTYLHYSAELSREFAGYGGCLYCNGKRCDKGPDGGAASMVRCSNRECHAEYVLYPGRMACRVPSKSNLRSIEDALDDAPSRHVAEAVERILDGLVFNGLLRSFAEERRPGLVGFLTAEITRAVHAELRERGVR